MFAKKIKLFTLLFVILTFVSAWAYWWSRKGVLLSAAITFGTFSYHFLMRLAVGFVIDSIFHNRIDYNFGWFREKKFEKPLYEMLGVKKWKGKMPTFEPEIWDPRKHTWTEIAGAMCQSEIVHLIIMVLSFVPIAMAGVWGAFGVFFITSVLAAGTDGLFVIMQRYNRPRVVKVIERQKMA